MSKYFDLWEMLESEEATERGISNTPSHDDLERLHTFMEKCLDPIREAWGKPIGVNSGYRCPALNRAVGGARTSQHLTGEAADITTDTIEGNKELFELIPSIDVEFDQLINESEYLWVHISRKHRGENRREILHL